MIALTNAYGLSREPFAQDIPVKDLYPLPGLESFLERFDYAVAQRPVHRHHRRSRLGQEHLAPRRRLPPSPLPIPRHRHRRHLGLPHGAPQADLHPLGDPPASNSIARMLALVRSVFSDIAAKKQIPVLIIDEAHLLRLDVFAQLHTLAQADFDSRTLLPIVLSGQIALIDKLLFHTSRPFASRVVGRSHMESLQRDHMADYLAHHVSIAGGTKPLFSPDAITAIHQSSGGMLRRAGTLARGALMAAAIEQCPVATAEHVRIASTEIL